MGDPSKLFLFILLHQGLFAIWAFAGAALAGPERLPHGLQLRPSRLGVLRQASLVFGFVLLSHGSSLLLARLRWSETGALAEIGQRVAQTKGEGPPELLLVVLAIGLAPAIGEELLFRGLIQQLARHWVPAGGAVLVSALAFGLLHLDLAQSSAAFLMGLYLGIAVERSGSLYVAMVAHGLNNTLGVLLPANVWGGVAPWSLQIGFAALAASAVILFLSIRRPRARSIDLPPGD